MSSLTRSRMDNLNQSDQSRIIEMAWEDRTPFEAIEQLYGLREKDVVAFMRRALKPSSFRLWRKRMSGRVTKHGALRPAGISRGYCPTQYKQR
ncbi:MAG: TIGR03643 family protein [Oleiphilaceae bacterium]|nr:TIGR03643 family protein [Oleiphilaceae bacterium]